MKKRIFKPGNNYQLFYDIPSITDYTYHGKTTFFNEEFDFVVDDANQVLFPTDFGACLIQFMEEEGTLNFEHSVLDIGCGSGLYPVILARIGYKSLTAIDINIDAIRNTRKNLCINNIQKNKVILETADIHSFRCENPFDLVVTNPSHLPSRAEYDRKRGIDIAALGGPDGREMYDEVIARSLDLVAPKGKMIIAHSSLANVPLTLKRLKHKGFSVRVAIQNKMDIPLLAYNKHKDLIFSELKRLEEKGFARFDKNRFWVEIIEAIRL